MEKAFGQIRHRQWIGEVASRSYEERSERGGESQRLVERMAQM